jgi:hypothetical protein
MALPDSAGAAPPVPIVMKNLAWLAPALR